MKKIVSVILSAALLLLCACGASALPEASDTPAVTAAPAPTQEVSSTAEPAPVPTPEPTPVTVPGVEALYSAGGYTVDRIREFFCENALPSEGSALLRWEQNVVCFMAGDCTQEDLDALNALLEILNGVENLPEFSMAEEAEGANLLVTCCTREELLEKTGDATMYEEADSAAILTCGEDNELTGGKILLRTDLSQASRDALLAKELLRSLGLVGDTALRSGSVLYSGFFSATTPDETDLLMLRLLYDSHLECGMTAEDCIPYLNSLIIIE